MGGLAFAQPGPNGEAPLKTPRMSPEVYHQLVTSSGLVIKYYYHTVIRLEDAPEKQDYGDIDFLVQGPKTSNANEQIARQLKAVRTLKNSLDYTLAIPRPDSPQSEKGQTFAQLDLREYPVELSLDWVKYMHSYGDLGQILGYLAYDYGITSNDKGFNVRIQEQEKSNWKGSMISLSNSSATVMQFLGLDPEVYAAGFKTEKEMFDWVRKSRTARHYPPQPSDGTTAAEPELLKENADHKRRMNTRPLFRRFHDQVLPTLPLLQTDLETARQELLEDALKFFNKQEEYDVRIIKVRADNDDEKARLLLVDDLSNIMGSKKKEKINEVVRGLRHWGAILPSSSKGLDIAVSPQASIRGAPAVDVHDELKLAHLLDHEGSAISKEVVEWLKINWETLKELERKKAKADRAGRFAGV